MQEVLDNSEQNTIEEPKAIDSFFKAYVIFHSVLLIISFLLSFFKASEDSFIGMIFRVLTFSVLGFHLLYFILLIVKKKGPGRIIINLFNSFSILIVAIGFIFYFAGWPFSMEMLTTGLVSVPFIMLLQLLYELSVRKDPSKFFSIVSSVGISTFAFGVLFVLQKWPYGKNMLIVGGLVTFAMMVIHFLSSLKKEVQYQIHIRYFAQCLFSLMAALLILLVNNSSIN